VSLLVARQQKFVGQFPSQQISAMLVQAKPNQLSHPFNSAHSGTHPTTHTPKPTSTPTPKKKN